MQRRLTTRVLALAAAGALTFGVAACGDDDDDASETDDVTTTEAAGDGAAADDTTTTAGAAADQLASDSVVVAKGFAFEVAGPVAPGGNVVLDNQDQAPHTMTADEGDAFDSGRVSGGDQGSVTAPMEPGDYAFHCEVHPNMTATLTVQ